MPADDRAHAADTVGSVLRALRRQRQLTAAQAAEQLGWSAAKISRVETAVSGIRTPDLRLLLDLYEADQQTRAKVQLLIEAAAAESDSSAVAIPFAYEKYIGLEGRATRMALYGAIVIPGLLQVPEYASALVRATPENEEEYADERLRARFSRQLVFTRSVRLDVVIDEAVLRRSIGDDNVMRLQMRRILEFMARPATTVQVLPLSVGAHPGLGGPFAILEFDDGRTPTTVFCDGLTGGVIRTDPKEVERYQKAFAALQELALDSAKSAKMINSVP